MNQRRTGSAVPADPLLSVVMPVFNERSTAGKIIPPRARGADAARVVVVDDRSTTGRARSWGFPAVARLQAPAPANAGKGAALRRGFMAVTGDLVSFKTPISKYSAGGIPQLIDLICRARRRRIRLAVLGRHRVFMFTHYLGNRIVPSPNILYTRC